MGYENYDMTPEATPETGNLGSFQNPIWTDMVSEDLMPKIRFTTDQAEAQEAAQADRSNPFDLPDAVFYVEPKSDAAEAPAGLEDFSFQRKPSQRAAATLAPARRSSVCSWSKI